jgi:hypothetical protein
MVTTAFFREVYSVKYKIKENAWDKHYDYIDQTTYIDAEKGVNDGQNHEKAKEKVLRRYPQAEIFSVELVDANVLEKQQEKIRKQRGY